MINKLEYHKGFGALMICGRILDGQRHEVYNKLIRCGIRDAEKLYDKLVELDSPLYWGFTKEAFAADYKRYIDDDSDDGEGLSASSRARRGE